MRRPRIGVDFGASKIEVAALSPESNFLFRERVPTPHSYDETIAAVVGLVKKAEEMLGVKASVGVGFPGRIDPATGFVQDQTALNGHPFDRDLAQALEREVRLANDAVCFAVSEATDGAGAGARVVFGAIFGSGVGGGVVVDQRPIIGANGLAGEWGHNPFPFSDARDLPGKRCWCGQFGCNETVLSGTALAEDYFGPGARDASSLPALAQAGDARAKAALQRHAERAARALAQVVNLIDPDVIVLGGGLSNMEHFYTEVPRLMQKWQFRGLGRAELRRANYGDSSGVRGAAWLWPLEAAEG